MYVLELQLQYKYKMYFSVLLISMCMFVTALVPYDENRQNSKKQASAEITTQTVNNMTGKMVAEW